MGETVPWRIHPEPEVYCCSTQPLRGSARSDTLVRQCDFQHATINFLPSLSPVGAICLLLCPLSLCLLSEKCSKNVCFFFFFSSWVFQYTVAYRRKSDGQNKTEIIHVKESNKYIRSEKEALSRSLPFILVIYLTSPSASPRSRAISICLVLWCASSPRWRRRRLQQQSVITGHTG